jgi:hypothetical protein
MSETLDPARKTEPLTPALGLAPAPAARKSSLRGVRCRQIAAADIDAILGLLGEGFGRLPRRHWVDAIELLSGRVPPDGMPRYGYMLESDGRAVGVLLLIATKVHRDGTTTTLCNGSAWYVRPSFRAYASFLLDRSLRLSADTHLNVFPASHTLPVIEARGFVRFSNGISLSVLAATLRTRRIRILHAGRLADAEQPICDDDRDLLLDHFRAGCVALWCETRDCGYPFVFRRRLIKSRLPCAQLIYCRDLADLTRLAGPLGRYLLRRGLPVVLAATNGPIPGVPGIYIDGMYPMYFRGETPPRLGDLSYTEAGLFGF